MARKKRLIGESKQEVNMTPMIDCTFQLIIFFILTAKMASDDLAKLVLPQPVKSQALTGDKEEGGPGSEIMAHKGKILVNVVNQYEDKKVEERDNPGLAARATYYKLSGNLSIDPGDVEQLVGALKERRQAILEDPEKSKGIKSGDIMIEIRADLDIEFQDIEPVMRAAAEAEISKMAMTALADDKK